MVEEKIKRSWKNYIKIAIAIISGAALVIFGFLMTRGFIIMTDEFMNQGICTVMFLTILVFFVSLVGTRVDLEDRLTEQLPQKLLTKIWSKCEVCDLEIECQWVSGYYLWDYYPMSCPECTGGLVIQCPSYRKPFPKKRFLFFGQLEVDKEELPEHIPGLNE